MSRSTPFPKNELLRYRQVSSPEAGKSYLLAMGTVQNRTGLRYKDYALRAKASRDGLEAILFDEEPLRKLRTDRDLYWTTEPADDDAFFLYAPSAKKYLNLDGQGARLSRKKQPLTLKKNGSGYQICAENLFLRCVARDDTPFGYVFTSATAANTVSFAFLERVRGIPAKPVGAKRLTAGSVSDVHIDYGVQCKAPYLRKAVFRAADAYRRRYDLDALITCGDTISDNGSHPLYNRGVLQGKFSREKFLKIQELMQKTLERSFRNPESRKNIFWISGNHDCQVGDRQPEGKRFNSNDWTHLLPRDLRNPLFRPAPMDVGVQEELLCYEYRVKGIPFLMLNTPLYPFAPHNPHVPDPHRPAPGHTLEQADWLEARLTEIEGEQGKNAVVFVLSHYPFHRGSFISYNPNCPSNLDAYVKMDEILNRFPNLFWCYGHVHGTDDWITHRNSAECMQSHGTVEMNLSEGGELICNDSPDRGNFRSDLILGEGFQSVFAGSLAYFETSYFQNDGKRFRSGLTDLEVPFAQGLAVEVYEDRVVLTMENFGTKEGTALIRGGTYKLKPMIYPLKKR